MILKFGFTKPEYHEQIVMGHSSRSHHPHENVLSMRYTTIGNQAIEQGLTNSGRDTVSGLRKAWEACRIFARAHRTVVRAAAASTCAGAIVLLGVQAMNLAPAQTASYERTMVVAAVPPSQQSITIANSGLAHIKGARVQAVSNSRIIAVSEWDDGTFRWTVHVDGDARIVRAGGELGALADIRAGDYVSITGHLAGESSNIHIEADSIRLSSPKEDAAPVVRLQAIEK